MALTTFLLRVAVLALLAALSPSTGVHATSISLPYNITADQVTDLKIDTGIDADDTEKRKRFNAYRVYLALTPPGWGTGPVCWLSFSEDLDTTQVNVTIPADVAPDETRIRISESLMKKGAENVNGYSYSNSVTFLGGNGTWSQRELDGWEIGDANKLSCWAYGCARRCREKYYTGDESQSSNGTGDAEGDACVKQCVIDFNPRSGAPTAVAPVFGILLAILTLAAAQILL